MKATNGFIRDRRRDLAVKMPRSLLTIAALVTATAAGAQSSPEPAGSKTLARQEMMRETAAAAKYLAETFAGKRSYDGAAARQAAETLQGGAGLHLTGQFRDTPDDPKSRALATISSGWSEFEAIALEMERLAALLASDLARSPDRLTDNMMMGETAMVQGNPLLRSRNKASNPETGGLPAEHVFHQLLQTCTACHATFRAPEK